MSMGIVRVVRTSGIVRVSVKHEFVGRQGLEFGACGSNCVCLPLGYETDLHAGVLMLYVLLAGIFCALSP